MLLERHLALADALGHVAVSGVEPLEPRPAVVVAVRILAVEHELAPSSIW